MNNIVCPKCGEIIVEGPECDSSGIITCEHCNEQIIWKCEDDKIEIKLHK